MSFKHLFARSLGADPARLHMAAHSHHLWPDASFDGQVECWNDAATLADCKWDKIMGEVWPEAQRHVADELGSGRPDAIVFASNTHDLLVRLVSACPRRSSTLRVLTTDGEFHSARRQFARWAEDGWLTLDIIPAEPARSFAERFLEAAASGDHDFIMVSHILFGTGQIFAAVDQLAALGRPDGPWVAIDGYHAFMAIPQPLGPTAAANAFYLGGGYKYAMAGEGAGFMHAPSGFGPRPPVTGWFAEFDDLSLPPGSVGYRPDAMRFMGATFDPSGLYRFNAVRRMLASNGLATADISDHVARLQAGLIKQLEPTALGRARLLNPPGAARQARFLAFRSDQAQHWQRLLADRNCIVDVRDDVLRVGLALYHDSDDVDRFCKLAADLPT